MNLLYPGFDDENQGEAVTIDNEAYPIHYQYYYILKIMETLEDEAISENDKVLRAIQYFYVDKIPEDPAQGLQACIDFIKRGNSQFGKNAGGSGNRAPPYDYTIDHQLIFASMCQAYGTEWYNWHWWRWKAAFDNLPDTSPIKQVIQIRMRKISSDMSAKEKANLRELKEIYSLDAQDETQLSAADLEAMVLRNST